MAVTGTGTQADPWIVHSYTELKDTVNSIQDQTPRYIKLGNNINCNDYGPDFEWETISVTWSNRVVDLDLDGKTIQNVKVKNGNSMFTWSVNSKIHNGKILNVFLSGAQRFIYGRDGGDAGTLEKLSISVGATGNTTDVFFHVIMKSCAVYCETVKQSASMFFNVTASNSDFMLIVNDQNYSLVFADSTFTGCRFKGEIGGICPNVNIYPYGDTRVFVFADSFNNCVIDFDMTGVTVAPSADNVYRGFNASTQTTVIDKSDWIPNLNPPSSWQFCTDVQITTGDYLNNNGFVVIPTSVSA